MTTGEYRDAGAAPRGCRRAEHSMEQKTAHVALFVPSLTVGGAQRVTTTVANGLAERGYEVDLLLSYNRGELAETVAGEVRVVDLETPQIPVVGIGASVPALRSYLEREEPDVLFSAMTYATVVVLAAAFQLGVDTRFVGVEHTTFGRNLTLKERLVTEVATRWYGSIDHVLAVSQGVADAVVERTRIDPERVSVQYNPVEVADIDRLADEAVDHPWLDGDHEVVLSVGRLDSPKDYGTLVRAFAEVNRKRPATRLVIAGTGSERDQLLELADSLGVGEELSLPGYVENPYRYMQRASVFALSSRYEGLPTVLIEALACGCPTVSTDCPSGPNEFLDDGRYGRLVPVGDHEALAEAIVGTLERPPDSESLRARAEAFAAPHVIDEYADFVDAQADLSGGR